jgi:hypothetical protein
MRRPRPSAMILPSYFLFALVDALKRSIPEGTRNAELKNEALRLARELLRGTKYEEG